MKKSIKRAGAAILLVGVLIMCSFGAVSAQEKGQAEDSVTAPSEQELYARGATLMDASTGRVLYDKNGSEKMPNASTTKIMTCILLLEQRMPEKELAEVSAYAASQPKVHLGMLQGEHYRVNDLLYSMMLESHNDSAAALAEHMGRNYLTDRADITSEEAVLLFADAMNRKAEEIGCQDTTFVTPNGLDAVRIREAGDRSEEVQHGTTAQDLARIMAYCVTKSPERDRFIEITQTAQYSFAEAQGKRQFTCVNHNAFLHMMDGVLSGKTGFTAKAGYCYVAALGQEEKYYTVALLACGWPGNKSYKWKDTQKLFSYGLSAYDRHALEECGEKPRVEAIPVLNGQGGGIGEAAFTNAVVDTEHWDDMEKAILLKKGQTLSMQVQAPTQLEAPIISGMKVGSVRIYAGDELWQECPLFAENSVEAINLQWCARQILCKFLLF